MKQYQESVYTNPYLNQACTKGKTEAGKLIEADQDYCNGHFVNISLLRS